MNPWKRIALIGLAAWLAALVSFALSASAGSSKTLLFVSMGLSAVAGPLVIAGVIGYLVTRSQSTRT